MCIQLLFILQLLNIELRVSLKLLYIFININWLKFLNFAYTSFHFSRLFDLQLTCNIHEHTQPGNSNAHNSCHFSWQKFDACLKFSLIYNLQNFKYCNHVSVLLDTIYSFSSMITSITNLAIAQASNVSTDIKKVID